ncbi:nicotinate-nucleotide--dimethylbenzimidazole phosphoribosyltransferase [Streptomyces sp. NPDC053499]|uniref:nicotinate-nucleotide--dimethylbenzimidazole phosphoribosyltransferase n=1 Tax=Streptomyces sp. NPDC053499 TaxID=3365707 RepID=UPI0037CCDAF1
MTDTGQIPGEGLPENAGGQVHHEPHEEEDLLMPSAQGAWNEQPASAPGRPIPQPQAQPQPETPYAYDAQGGPQPVAGQQLPQDGQLTPEAPYAHEGGPVQGEEHAVNGYAQHGYQPQDAAYVHDAAAAYVQDAQATQQEQPSPDAAPASAPQPEGAPAPASADQPEAGPAPADASGPHVADSGDSGSPDMSAAPTPQQPSGAPASAPGTSGTPGAPGQGPRRPLHLGPPVPEQSGTVRPLSERAAAPAAPVAPQAAPVQGAPVQAAPNGPVGAAAPQPAASADGRLPAEQPQQATAAQDAAASGQQPTAPAVMDPQNVQAPEAVQPAGPQPAPAEPLPQQPEAQIRPQTQPQPQPEGAQQPGDEQPAQAAAGAQAPVAPQPAPQPVVEEPLPGPQLGQLPPQQDGWATQQAQAPEHAAPEETAPAEGGQAEGPAAAQETPAPVAGPLPGPVPAQEGSAPNETVPGPRQEAQPGGVPTVPAQGGESQPQQDGTEPTASMAPPIDQGSEEQGGARADSAAIPEQATAPASPGDASEPQPHPESAEVTAPAPDGAEPAAVTEAEADRSGETGGDTPAEAERTDAGSAGAVNAESGDAESDGGEAPAGEVSEAEVSTGEPAPAEPAEAAGGQASATEPGDVQVAPGAAAPGAEADDGEAPVGEVPAAEPAEAEAPEAASAADAPDGQAPTAEAPVAEASTGEAPGAEQRGTEAVDVGAAPSDEAASGGEAPPTGEVPPAEAASDAEAAAAPVAAASEEQAPTAEAPVTESSTAEAPTTEATVTEPGDEVAEGGAVAAEAAPEGEPAPGYAEAEREAVHRLMRERRDIRNGFRPDPIPHEVLLRVLEAAHTAPSVGHSQPWDFVVIRSEETRRTMHELAERQRQAYAKSLPKGRAKQFKEMKIEAILDTPVNIVVTADPTRGGRHTLGRQTQPQMAPYSSALAVENLWLAARAEGLGVGWVSFFDERELVRTLELPEHLEVVAYLCIGYVDEFPDEPELMQAGWSKRRPLSWVVHEESYGRRALPGAEPTGMLAETLGTIRPLDAKALGEAWERQKRMTKPAGALGMLEIISAQLCGLSRKCPPPVPEPAAVAIFAGDHGVHAQGVTPWPQEVTAQMVANFLGGGAVCNAFANQVGAEVCVVDVGVAAELPATPGLLPRKVRPGTADMTAGPALTQQEVERALEVGIETARDLVAAGNKALLTGEMGIANTTASAALIAACTGADPAEVTGRGTGINDETHARKVEVVRRALELHQPDPADPLGMLSAFGGLEHAAMVGLILGGASLRTPVILDGVSAGAAALVARAVAPEALAACIAGHRSAEPGHVAALTKLGLRPLVDLDLRLGEGTGALLALPMVQSAARAMHEVATFDAAGVTEKG